MEIKPRHLSDYLLSQGEPVITLEQAAALLNLTPKAATRALARLRESNHMFSPARGLYIAVPPHYRTWNTLPGLDFIDPMMKTLGRGYYVALLSAAALHSVAHQQPQVFQVMVDKPLPKKELGRTRLWFYHRPNVQQVPVVLRNNATGQARVATCEVTALDVAARPRASGGLSNAATVIGEMLEENMLTAQRVVDVVPFYAQSQVRRFGWLLDRVGGLENSAEISQALEHHLRENALINPAEPVALDPSSARRGPINARWGVIENAEVEPDL